MTDGSSAAGASHNDPNMDQQKALFLNHFGKVKRLSEKLESAKADLRNAYKSAKTEGFNKKDFDLAKLLEKGDDAELVDRRRRDAMIAQWFMHPLGKQAELFDKVDTADSMPAEDKAFELGKLAAMKGETCQPPHDTSTPQGQKWIAGWHEGNGIVANIQTPLLTREGKPKGSDKPAKDKGGRRSAKDALRPASDATDQMRKDDAAEAAGKTDKPKAEKAKNLPPKKGPDYNDQFKADNGIGNQSLASAEEQAGAAILGQALPETKRAQTNGKSH